MNVKAHKTQSPESKQLKQCGKQFVHVLAGIKNWLDKQVLATIGEQVDPEGVKPIVQLVQVTTTEATIVHERQPVPHRVHWVPSILHPSKQAEHYGTPETISHVTHPGMRCMHVWHVEPNKIYPWKVLHVHWPFINWKLGSQTRQSENDEHVAQVSGQALHD
jgi:hypothetical protein